MADITMCQNRECRFADNCYRFCAEPNEKWQSYADYRCVQVESANSAVEYFCPGFIPISIMEHVPK